MENKLFIVDQVPFYKDNLFYEISKVTKIEVISIGHSEIPRGEWFYKSNHSYSYNIHNTSSFKELIKLIINLKDHNYDIIVNGYNTWKLYLVILLFRCSIIVENGKKIESKNINPIKRILKKIIIFKAKKIYLPTADSLGFQFSSNRRDKLVITNTVGLPFSNSELNKIARKINRIKRDIDVLYIGRENKEKNPQFVRKLLEHCSSKHLNVCSIGLTVGGNVVHHNHADRDLVIETLLRTRILVLPSYYEPYGLVCEEAIYCGAFVICSNVVGASNNPYLFGQILAIDRFSVEMYMNQINTHLKRGSGRKWNGSEMRKEQVNSFLGS